MQSNNVASKKRPRPSSGPNQNSNLEKVQNVQTQDLIAKAVNALHQSKKLLLVLDIDHTLVHCTKDERADIVFQDPQMNRESFKMYFKETGNKPYYLKLRPFIGPFLETLSQFFHLAV